MIQVEIDSGSGFCFGVTTAIKKAEEELAAGKKMYCLGDIVHNGMEVERLTAMGMTTINHEQLKALHDVKVLLRAHGEPPETYELAKRNNIEIIDATCPVVLQLQKRIKKQFDTNPNAQIVIFGKNGHAEVLGLVGQTRSEAIVIEHFDEVHKLDFERDIYLYSQRVWTSFIESSNTSNRTSVIRLFFAVSIRFADRWLTACQTLPALPPNMM